MSASKKTLEKIGVIGAGVMGHSVAETFAMGGFDVTLYDINDQALAKGMDQIGQELQVLVEEGYFEKKDIPVILSRIRTTTDLADAVKDRDFVIENAPEKIELKQNLFRQLIDLAPADAILASNTSSLVLSEMIATVPEEHKSRILITHFFNPAHLIPLVEVSAFGNMPEDRIDAVVAMYEKAGKRPIRVVKEWPGLAANRIMQAVAREVFSLVEHGIASPEDIDRALKFGPAFRYATTGQLEVSDFGGLAIWCTVGDTLLPKMDARQSASEVLRAKVKEGKLGVSTGEGFYKYPGDEAVEAKNRFNRRLIAQLKASRSY